MNKTIRKAFKFRLKTTPEVAQKLTNFAGGCRYAWNKALALNLDRLKEKQPILWYHELNFWVTLWKQSDEYSFLNELPAQALQQKLQDLDKAFKDGFDKTNRLNASLFLNAKVNRIVFAIHKALKFSGKITVFSCQKLAG